MNLTNAAKHIGISTITLCRAVECSAVEADHPVADGPWVFKREHLDEPKVRETFENTYPGEAL